MFLAALEKGDHSMLARRNPQVRGSVGIVAPFLWVFTCGTLYSSMSAAVALRVFAVLASAASADGVASVALDGDPELGSAVAQALAERGIRVVSSAGTESVRVHVQPDLAGIRLFIYDRNGHTVERIVANAEVAAAVVESWVRDDLARSLLDPHEVSTTGGAPAKEPLPPTAGPASGPAVASAVSAPAHSGGRSRPTVTVVADTSLATDGTLWIGAALGACVRVGRFCVGVDVQFSGDTAATGNVGALYAVVDSSNAACTEPQRKLTRMGGNALMTADLPLRVGAGTLGPGIGLGAGWLSTNAVLDQHSGNATTVGLVAEPRIQFSWPLGWGLAADVGLRADILPFAHRKHLTSSDFNLPGEPLGFLHAGLGLRYGPLAP